jgi:hypothetical protein
MSGRDRLRRQAVTRLADTGGSADGVGGRGDQDAGATGRRPHLVIAGTDHGSFDSVADLKRKIDEFVKHYNQHPQPFI